MYLLQSLFLIAPLAALTNADDQWSHGIPAAGVTCATSQESAHVLDNSTLTSAITAGSSNQYTAITSQWGNQNIFYPQPFNDSSLGTDSAGNAYTIKYADGCNATQGLLYAPVGYQNASGATYSAPVYSGSSLPALESPPTPASPISSDIVLFTASVAQGEALSAQFCAVLTNSDAASSDWLYIQQNTPSLSPGAYYQNPTPKGYHECNPN